MVARAGDDDLCVTPGGAPNYMPSHPRASLRSPWASILLSANFLFFGKDFPEN